MVEKGQRRKREIFKIIRKILLWYVQYSLLEGIPQALSTDVLENSLHYNFSISPQNDAGDTMGDIHDRTNLSYELLAHVRAYADKAGETPAGSLKPVTNLSFYSIYPRFNFPPTNDENATGDFPSRNNNWSASV